jgi:hypothetical protein
MGKWYDMMINFVELELFRKETNKATHIVGKSTRCKVERIGSQGSLINWHRAPPNLGPDPHASTNACISEVSVEVPSSFAFLSTNKDDEDLNPTIFDSRCTSQKGTHTCLYINIYIYVCICVCTYRYTEITILGGPS